MDRSIDPAGCWLSVEAMTMTPGRHCSALLLSLLLALLLIMEPASAFLPSGSRLQQATTSTATPLR